MKSRSLLQKLTGHISEVSNQSKLNFGLVGFLYGPNMCANFQRNLRGCRFFDPFELSGHFKLKPAVVSRAILRIKLLSWLANKIPCLYPYFYM